MFRSMTKADRYVRDLAPWPTACPSWCTVGTPGNPHVRHLEFEPADGMPQRRIHDGPRFGAVEVYGTESLAAPGVLRIRSAVVTSSGRNEDGTDDLRQLSADTLAAAEWIEAES